MASDPPNPRDLYRPLARADCGEIARMYNRNLESLEPLWCAGGRPYDAGRVWLHSLTLLARGRGRGFSQVHERGGRILSYFAAYARGRAATFTIGVVDLDLPDPHATWREDTRHLFRSALDDGVEVLQIRASSDRAWFVGWMENDVGMCRLDAQRTWTAGYEVIVRYLSSAAGGPRLLGRETLSDRKLEDVSA